MKRPASMVFILLLLATALARGETAVRVLEPGTDDTTVAAWEVVELRLRAERMPDNPFRDARAEAEFVGPDGRSVRVEGFYYGDSTWCVRFVPRIEGTWHASAVLTTPDGAQRQTVRFTCRGRSGRGFLRLSSRNPHRMEYEDGTPFYPLGIQPCDVFDVDFDGPPPPGRWRTIPAAQWVGEFEGAVNLVRTQLGQGTTDGCAVPLIAPGGPADRYDTALAARLEDVLAMQRRRGMSQILILFQDMSQWGDSPTAFGRGRDVEGYKSLKAPNLELQERYVRYVVARFGCFVDVWEIFNEDSYAPDDYLARLARVIRDADPYDHIITTNYQRPNQSFCEILSVHEYMGMPAGGVDSHLAKELAGLKSHGKVVLYTEFGNQQILSNVDPIKWRLAAWTAFMNESGLVFWGMSGKQYPAGTIPGNANAYIGPDSRRHFRVLNRFVGDLPVDMRPTTSGYTHHHDRVRSYALSNGQVTVLYVHHFADHEAEYQLPVPLLVQTGPGRFKARWINPDDGSTIREESLETRGQYLEVPAPAIRVDAACRIDRQ